jgi:DHA1 family bicyclomycin/chloramphenicol resistance-like MFS transporter
MTQGFAPAPARRLGTPEFVAMLALLISLVALSVDAMLPALGEIARDLGVSRENDRQLVISALFLGLATGQIVYGPLSDSIGRKPAIYLGLVLFIAGSLMAAAATSFDMLLAGRVLEGFGAAGPRIVAVAMVRDLYEGRPMARIMSLAMSIFILVPVFAPALGQAIMLIAPWRAIFALLLGLAILGVSWLAVRQPETLAAERRSSLSLRRIGRDIAEVLGDRQAMGYILATGFVFVAFVAYLQTSQQVFAELYGKKAAFPVYFGLLAGALGVAAVVNSRLVMSLGMRRLSWIALVAGAIISCLFLIVSVLYGGKPPLLALVGAFAALFFAIGILFGNFNALAMEHMGHIAGTASAVVGSLTTLMSMVGGGLIGYFYDNSITPLVAGFAACSLAAIASMAWAEGAGKIGEN